MPKIEPIASLILSAEKCMRNSLTALRENLIVAEPNIAGWRRFLGPSDSVGAFGTACGLMAYCSVNPTDLVTISRISGCLREVQQSDGSWDSPTIIPGLGLTTATCYTLLALRSAGLPSRDPVFGRALAWLESSITSEGGIGLWSGDTTPYLVSTALCLQTFAVVDEAGHATRVAKLLNWFSNVQNANGGFASKAGLNSTLHHTSQALIALTRASGLQSETESSISRAKEYLFANWNLGQNIYRDIFYVEHNGRRAMLPHTYQTDGLLLQAKLALDSGGYDERTVELVQHLARTQTGGHWVHQSIPDKIPTWGIMECVLGLREFVSRTRSDSRIVAIEAAVLNVENKVTLLEGAANSAGAELKKQANQIAIFFSIYKYRYVLGALYLLSIYLFVRSNLGPTQPVADIVAVIVAGFIAVVQLVAAIRNRSNGED